MIGVFPDPYPDEIFYSICARLCERAGYSKHRIAMRDIFGSEAVIASVVLPSHLDDLVSRLPPGSAYTSDYLIAEHTLLPLYSPFLPPERLSCLRQDMCGRNGPSLHMRSGIMASRVPLPEWLRFCPQCVVEDKKQYGECYWHRVHQAPGVVICPLHEMYLCDSYIRTRNKKTRHKFVSAESALQGAVQYQPTSRDEYRHILLAISRDIYWLLCQPYLSGDPKLLHSRYRKLLAENDLATYRGRVEVSMLLSKFENSYPPRLLKLLNCEIEEHIKENWLLRLVRAPHGSQHPLHNLLLIHFLRHSAESFFGLLMNNKPFGDGPWPCLNLACDHYRQPQIEDCYIVHSQYTRGRPIGTFGCSCGFTYSRTGPDTSTNDQFRLDRIKSFGHVWETKLRTLWSDKAESLRNIALHLGVEPHTAKRHAIRMGLSFPRTGAKSVLPEVACGPQPPPVQASKAPTTEARRTAWLATMQAYPGAGIKELRDKEPKVYKWLYKNDNAWLKEHRPPRTSQIQPQLRRVDWEKRDLQLAAEVSSAALHIKNLPGRPVRLTISTLGREIGKLALIQQHLHKLPRTADTLRELVETREAFAVRRLWWATEDYQQRHIYPQKWQLVRRAGVTRLADRPRVKEAIDAILLGLPRSAKN